LSKIPAIVYYFVAFGWLTIKSIPQKLENKKGLVLVYTSDGKGKTTAAIGLAFRAPGHEKKICKSINDLLS